MLPMGKPAHPGRPRQSVDEKKEKGVGNEPVSRVLFRTRTGTVATISLGRRLLAASSSLPESQTDRTNPPGHRASTLCSMPRSFLLGLAPGGVCLAEPVTRPAGELLPHRFTLTCDGSRAGSRHIGGLLSVALSLASPRGKRSVGVTHHPVLWSPDFPPARIASRRPPGSPPNSFKSKRTRRTLLRSSWPAPRTPGTAPPRPTPPLLNIRG